MEQEETQFNRRRRWGPTYQRRRPVPWRAFDVVTICAFWFALQLAIAAVFFSDVFQPTATPPAGELSADHTVVKLLKDGDPWVVLLCFVSATVVAPIGEEFLFRLLLQGWLESAEHRWRRRSGWLRRNLPRALAPIALSALLFAAMHGRGASNHDTRYLFSQLLIYAIATGLTPVFGIGWLRFRAGATAMDLGWNVSKLKQDIGLGLLCSVVLVPPILLLQNVLLHVLPKSAAPDPIPLFLFAVAWGFLYYCTHRIVPAIIAHASLNATSLALFFLLASSSR